MNYHIVICCLALAASAKADDLGLGGLVYAPGHASPDYYAYPRYAFEYAVKDPHTGDNKAQWEKRDGDVVKGAYSLVEPDGTLRVVEYYADDKSGFNAVVKRVGPNVHPAVVSAPIYKAPIPLLSSGAIAAPISVGSVAKYHGLANAPLITGHVGNIGHVDNIGHHAVSTASLYKAPVVVAPAPIAPIVSKPAYIPAPILPAPIPYKASILPALGYGGIGHGYAAPIAKTAPIIYPDLIKGPLLSGAYNPYLSSGLIKGPVLGYDDHDIGIKGYGLSSYGGPWDLGLGLKH